MFALIVSYHARQEQYVFTASDPANVEMSAIEAKIGKKWYGKNGDEETPTYRFKHSDGEAAICLEKVESVSVIDLAMHESIEAICFERRLATHVQQKTLERQALAKAGLTGVPQAAE